MNPSVIQHFFKVHGKETSRCHEASEKCTQPAIRAHSVPSSQVLSALADQGHLVMPKMNLKIPPDVSEIEFKLVGINRATTFTGLCSHHDSEIFRPIDVESPDLANDYHLFLLAYRAVLREFHVVLQNVLRFQSTYLKSVEVGSSPKDTPDNLGWFATSHIVNGVETYMYKRGYDKAFQASNWSYLKHHVIELKDQTPTLAVSSMFSLDNVDAPETPRVTLSVYPVSSGTSVVFSATDADYPFVSIYLGRLLNSENYLQKYLLSKLVLQSCDNFALSPKFFATFSDEKQAAITKFYAMTTYKNAEDYEDQNLYLF